MIGWLLIETLPALPLANAITRFEMWCQVARTRSADFAQVARSPLLDTPPTQNAEAIRWTM
jgi:hypothetical protein